VIKSRRKRGRDMWHVWGGNKKWPQGFDGGNLKERDQLKALA
jgi:hypothetical protein